MVTSMKRYLRIIKNNLQSVFSIGNLCCMVVIFIYIFAVKYSSIKNIDSFSEVVKKIFIGPNNLTDNILEVFIWMFYELFLIYMIGNYCFKEFDTRSIYTMPRLGNKKHWHICLQITCFFTCIIYFAFGISIGVICTSVMNKGFNLNGISEVFKTMGLLSLSSYYIITLYILSTIVSRKHTQSFLVLITTLCLSLEFGEILKIDKYIPFNQGILSKHIISNFSYQWSFIFLAIFIFINLIFINKLLVKRDLFEIVH